MLRNLFIKVCPKSLMKAATVVIRKSRAFRCRTDMVLLPKKMTLYCPCCGTKMKSFVSAEYLKENRFNQERYKNMRQDVICPVCRSLPRHRILASWCEKNKELLKGKVLYFAPEHSMELWMKRNGVKYTTADLYRGADLKLDIQETGLKGESYDVVIANHVLEHIDDFRVALKEVRRILKPFGLFICSFPIDPRVEILDEDPNVKTDEERIYRFGQNDHKRVFGMKADQFLREAGFTVEIIDGGDYPEEILPVVGPADYDMNRLFCCRK